MSNTDQRHDDDHDTPEYARRRAFEAEMLTLTDACAEAVAVVAILPGAHEAEDKEGKRAKGTTTASNHGGGSVAVRPAPPFDTSPIDGAIALAEKRHDAIKAALADQGIAADDPRAHFVIDVVRRRQRVSPHPLADLPNDVRVAVAALGPLADLYQRRTDAFLGKPAPKDGKRVAG